MYYSNILYVIEEPLQIMVPDTSLDDLLGKYCICDLSGSSTKEVSPKKEFIAAQNELKRKNKKLCIEEIDFSDKILLLSSIVDGILNTQNQQVSRFLIKSKRKPITPKGKNSSSRRSKFIGVSKNGSSHQVLISVEGKKTYLGSFENEYEAAVTFDFYSILLHSVEAKTNFSYTAQDVQEMIHSYKVYKNLSNFYPKIVEQLNGQ
ncbi:unnamed protein product [Moneuplotes crassus]|uniref:AP2/ERF domain-containing protein n=1 Tax=Euplotes crassus TaxID=5936 RepID=A0AAD1XR16_EUPCR|nr:unnamed protein product [Moneuplotes crassus]